MASLDERGPGFVGIAGGQARRDAQRNGKNAESYATELTQNARLNHDILLRTAARPLLTFDRQGREALSYTPNARADLTTAPHLAHESRHGRLRRGRTGRARS